MILSTTRPPVGCTNFATHVRMFTRRQHRSRVTLATIGSLLCLSCAPTHRAGVWAGDASAVAGASALMYLPSTTALAIVLPGGLADVPWMNERTSKPESRPNDGWNALIRDAIPSAVSDWLSVDSLLISIDQNAPIGGALLDLESMTSTVFAAVADRDALYASIRERASAAGIKVREARVGQASIVSAPDRGVGVVIQEDAVFFVWSPVPSQREAAEVRIAGGAAQADSLVSDERFRTAVAALPNAGWMTVFVDMSALARPMVHAAEAVEVAVAEVVHDARERERQARVRGASQGEQLGLRKQTQQAERVLMEARRRTGIERAFTRELVAGWGGVAMAVNKPMRRNDDRATPTVNISIAPRPGSVAADVLAPPSSSERFRALAPGNRPKGAFVGRLQAERFWTVFALVAQRWWNADIDRVQASIARQLNIDLANDIASILSGDVRTAFDMDGTLTVDIGFHDRQTSAQLFSRIANRLGRERDPQTSALVLSETPQMRVELQESAANWTLTVRPTHLAERSTSDVSGERPRSSRTQPSAALRLDIEALVPHTAAEPLVNVVALPPLPEDQNPDVPLSAEHRRRAAEYASITSRMKQHVTRATETTHEQTRQVARALGDVVIELTSLERRGERHIIGAATLSLGVADIHELGVAVAGYRTKRRAQINAARSTIRSLVDQAQAIRAELTRIRARDVQAWDLRH